MALWASIGCPETSPMARIRLSLVRHCSSMTTKPWRSISTSVFSNSDEIGLEKTDVEIDRQCFVVIDEQCRTRDVADGQDSLVSCAALLVYDHEALAVYFHIGFFQPDFIAVGPPAHGHEHSIELKGTGSILTFERYCQTIFAFLNFGDLGAQP